MDGVRPDIRLVQRLTLRFPKLHVYVGPLSESDTNSSRPVTSRPKSNMIWGSIAGETGSEAALTVNSAALFGINRDPLFSISPEPE